MNLLIAGSIGFDTIATPFGRVDDVLGGSAVYASLAASIFSKPGIVGIAGTDFTEEQKKILTDSGIDLAGLEIKNGKTFRWGAEYDFNLNNRTTLFTELNTLADLNPVLPENYQNSEYIFLGSIGPVSQLQILDQLMKPKFIAMDTIAYWIENFYDDLLKVLPQVDAVIINDSEARQLSEESNIHKAAKKILGMMELTPTLSLENRGRNSGATEGGPLLVIKRGEYGVMMFQGDQIFFLPAFPIEEVFDPTGAGDSFAGAFMGYLAANGDMSWKSLKKACVAGSVLGSFCVEKMGIDGLINLDKNKIKNRLTEFKKLTEFDLIAT